VNDPRLEREGEGEGERDGGGDGSGGLDGVDMTCWRKMSGVILMDGIANEAIR